MSGSSKAHLDKLVGELTALLKTGRDAVYGSRENPHYVLVAKPIFERFTDESKHEKHGITNFKMVSDISCTYQCTDTGEHYHITFLEFL